jgi:hypothetical protein
MPSANATPAAAAQKPLWFVKPGVARLDLPDLGEGQWIEIKEQITYAEQQRLFGSMIRTMKTSQGENEMGVDLARSSILKLVTWVVDWSARDEDDKPVPLTPDAIENLTPDVAKVIEDAIDAHNARREEGKVTLLVKTPNGKP